MKQINLTKVQAERFVERDVEIEDDIQAAISVLQTLGDPKNNLQAHWRHVRFLLAGVKRFVWAWRELGCDLPGPEVSVKAIEEWLENPVANDALAMACIPCQATRDGAAVTDCDESALTDLASAASRLAYFCYTKNITDAAMVLVALYWSAMENLQSDDGVGFEKWLVDHAPNLAWNKESKNISFD